MHSVSSLPKRPGIDLQQGLPAIFPDSTIFGCMIIDQTTQEQRPGLTTGTLSAALSRENSGPVMLTVLNEPFQLPRRSTGATKPDVVVPVIRIVPVAIGGAEILRIVVPRTAPIRPLSLL